MTKRSTTWRGVSWRRGAARGLLALAVLGLGTSTHVQLGTWTSAPPIALAEEIDCIDDKDNFDLPECVQQREAAQREAEQARRAQEAQQAAEEQAASEQAAPPAAPTNNPWDIVFKIADAGKEATQYISEEKSDPKYGRWARTRYERERTTSASTLGPNVIDTQAWVTKDVEAARALFKEQAAIKNFPERKEGTNGPNEKVKPVKVGEEYSVDTQYYQDDDGKIWLHFRFVIRNGKNVGVLYLFGREDFFAEKEKNSLKWNGQGDWYITEFANRI